MYISKWFISLCNNHDIWYFQTLKRHLPLLRNIVMKIPKLHGNPLQKLKHRFQLEVKQLQGTVKLRRNQLRKLINDKGILQNEKRYNNIANW